MIKKIIACTMSLVMSLTIISNSVCALPNFNPATTDFSDSILGKRNVKYSIPDCETCENYIMRYEYVEKILQLMNELFVEAEKNKEENLRDLNKAKGIFEKIEKITGWSAHLVEKVLQNTFDSLKESPNKTKIASELAQAAVGASIAIPSAVSLFSSSTAAAGTAATATTGAVATTAAAGTAATATTGAVTTTAAAGTAATATTGAVATTATAGTAATGAVATTAATGTTTAGTAAAGTAAAGGAPASAVAVTALKYAGMFGGTVLVVAGLGLAGYTAYSCYVDNKNHLEDIKINNYTSTIGQLYLSLLDEDWKGNNVLIIAFDHGKDTPGAYTEFYKVDGIDYGNKDFGVKFNRILNQLNAYFQSDNANNPALPSSKTIIDRSWNSAELQPKLNNI